MIFKTLLIDFFIVTYLVYIFSKDFHRGLNHSVFLLILIPQSVGIEIGPVPVITTQRIILVLMLVNWLRHRGISKRNLTFMKLFIGIIIANTISLFLAEIFVPALKRTIGFLLENFVFYVIFVSSYKKKEELEAGLKTIYSAIILISILAVLERYTVIRPLYVFPSFDNIYLSGDVFSTLPHPIHLGIVTAIGLILSMYYLDSNEDKKTKPVILWLWAALNGAVLYFTGSRGPWIAAIMGFFILFLMSKFRMKGRLIVIFILPLLVFVIRPGVYDSVQFLYNTTLDPNTPEGASYTYRLELWNQAYMRIKQSPKRFLFGYGMEYHRYANLFGYFSLIADRRSQFQSWDNEFATLLLEGGFIGLFLYSILYLQIVKKLFFGVIKHRGNDRKVLLALFTCVLMVIFMMTNVKMFSTQVLFVFYSIVAFGLNLLAVKDAPKSGSIENLHHVQ